MGYPQFPLVQSRSPAPGTGELRSDKDALLNVDFSNSNVEAVQQVQNASYSTQYYVELFTYSTKHLYFGHTVDSIMILGV